MGDFYSLGFLAPFVVACYSASEMHSLTYAFRPLPILVMLRYSDGKQKCAPSFKPQGAVPCVSWQKIISHTLKQREFQLIILHHHTPWNANQTMTNTEKPGHCLLVQECNISPSQLTGLAHVSCEIKIRKSQNSYLK